MNTISTLEKMLTDYSAALEAAKQLSGNARHEIAGAESDIERRNLIQQRGDAIRVISWGLSKRLSQDFEALKVSLAKDTDTLLNL